MKLSAECDAPSQDLLGLVLGIKSLRRVLVRQHVVPFILCHDSGRVPFATSLIRDTPCSFTRISMVHSPRRVGNNNNAFPRDIQHDPSNQEYRSILGRPTSQVSITATRRHSALSYGHASVLHSSQQLHLAPLRSSSLYSVVVVDLVTASHSYKQPALYSAASGYTPHSPQSALVHRKGCFT